jgi:methionine synthase reductase
MEAVNVEAKPKRVIPPRRSPSETVEPPTPKVVIWTKTETQFQRLNPLSTSFQEVPFPQKGELRSIVGDKVEVFLSKAEWLTTSTAVKQVLHLSFAPSSNSSLATSSWLTNWRPGDALGISCPNRDDEVDLLLERLNLTDLSEDEIIIEDIAKWRTNQTFDKTQLHTIRSIFSELVDVSTGPKLSLLRVLSLYTSDPEEKASLLHLASPKGKDEYRTQIQEGGEGLLGLLLRFPNTRPPLSHLISELPPLQPRFYSLCSSRDRRTISPNTFLEVAVSLTTWKTMQGNLRHGLCSHYLAGIAETCLGLEPRSTLPSTAYRGLGSKLESPIFVTHRHSKFRPPKVSAPLIMIGPGTGVAPFIGFLQEREALAETPQNLGKSWLFFGCRHKVRDFLFEEELKRLQKQGTLSHLVTSFSRDTEEVQYVQHALATHSQEVFESMNNPDNQGYIYVCGEARGMARDVRECLLNIIAEHNTQEDPQVCLNRWMKEGRFLLDVWA